MDHRTERLRRRAATYLELGDHQAAARTLEAVLEACPDDDAARLDLSLALLHGGQYRSARQHALQACIRAPGDPALLGTRLEALRAFSAHGAMRQLARQADPAQCAPAGELARVAEALESFGDCEEATRWITAAAQRAPSDPLIRVQQALIDLDSGRLDAARRHLQALVDGPAVVPMAHWLLARLHDRDESRQHVPTLRALMQQAAHDPGSLALLGFALHKALDNLGQHAEAWDALQTACRAKRSQLRYSPADTAQLFDQLIASCPVPPPADVAPAGPAGALPVPIFIVGLFRSGTTLLERILGAHPAVAVGGESLRFSAALRAETDTCGSEVVDAPLLARADRIDAARLQQDYLAAHDWLLQGRTHFTEKLPSNFQLIGLIRQTLPHARILHLVRDPMDTCWSNLRELFGGSAVPYSYDPDELADYHHQYRRLMAHWHQAYPGRILDVAYADLVQAPEATARTVLAFCGLPWVEGCTAIERQSGPVRTASALQVRQPIHRDSLARWRPYAQWLEPLRQALDRAPARAPSVAP